MGECISYSTNKGREFVETIQEEWAHKWPNKTMYYDVINICRTMTTKQVRRALNCAMTTWDLEIDVTFKPIWWMKNKYPHLKPNLTIDFKSSDEDDHFAQKPSVLAYAYFPGQGSVSGKVVFNNDYIWSMNGKPISGKDAKAKGWVDNANDNTSIRTYNIITVLIHELGHSLGLRHDVSGNKNGNDVMDAFYDGQLELSDRDIYRIRKKYPARIFSRWSHYARLKKAMKRIKSRF